MENISQIIQEAKGLYFERKRKRRIAKVVLGIFMPVVFLLGTLSTVGNYEQETYLVSSGVSVIEQMGLPVDEDGFLLVNE